jgi:hypothetical protein
MSLEMAALHTQLPPSLLWPPLSSPRRQSPWLPPLLASRFSSGMLLRYPLGTMSRNGRSSFSPASEAPASANPIPTAFAFGPPLPRTSSSASSSAVGHRSRQACGCPWQTSSRSVDALGGGWRRLPDLAIAPTLLSARSRFGSPAYFATTARPNPSVNRTPGLRPPVAGYLRRWAS